MPSLSDAPPNEFQRVLVMADSGAGKTGALASLAEAGYNLYVWDFDAGLEPLVRYTTPAARSRIQYETLKDTVKMTGAFMKAVNPKAFKRAMELLDKWPERGDPAKFGPDSIVVIDSLSFMGKMAMYYVLDKNAQTVARIQDWGEAQNLLTGVLTQLTSKTFGCHVIIMTHINYLESSEGVIYKGWPSAIGKAMNTEIPKYFNIMLGVENKGVPKVITKPKGFLDYKFPHPDVKADYPIATGLRDIFKLLRGTEPKITNSPATPT